MGPRACGLRQLQPVGSEVAASGLQSTGSVAGVHRLSYSRWDIPGPEIEPMSPALAGRLFTTDPPGKPLNNLLKELNPLVI